ncbi:hypothetical protein Aasi_0094 [Candidatus Amoebophilus asiaticus 5a2]|uniref:Transcription factor zinc-finger domain-containing protein n=1 Tax=Amoebophilus asiaticus (strain 5a2) TaxID=452471 RepID=B3EUC3_AMOA5|nr:hypothetical protein [Candidatus Amoebophilus asiaticus]ACE05542.1 hypothetical protein Aasi_0094 [Candidatus Amoebophilus asiaticus 5a2]
MKNKNQFTIITRGLGILIVSILLNSCGVIDGNMKENHTNSSNDKGKEHKHNYDKVVCLCPVCKGGCRYFYRLSNREVVLLCEECSAVWLGTKNLDRDGIATDDVLKEQFNVADPEELFDEGARWATKEEAERSTKWAGLEKSTEFVCTY